MDQLSRGRFLSRPQANKYGVLCCIAVAFLSLGTQVAIAAKPIPILHNSQREDAGSITGSGELSANKNGLERYEIWSESEESKPFLNLHCSNGEVAGSNPGGGEFPPNHNVSTSLEISPEAEALRVTAHEVNKLVGIVRKISCRIFQLRALEEQKWPELKFGWRTVTAVILGGVGAALSSAGGLGGGGIFVPLFNLLLQFDTKTSAVLSNFMILGGAVANLYINLRQHHPTACHKPLIDFDVVLLFQPNMLLGISTGVILNVILPEWVITALLTVTLGYMVIHSFKGGLRRWRKETNQNRQRKIAGAAEASTAAQAGFESESTSTVPYVPAPDFHHHHRSNGDNYSSDSSSCVASDDDDDVLSVSDSLLIVPPEDEIDEETHKSHRSRLVEKQHSENGSNGSREASQPLLGAKDGGKEGPKARQFPVDKILALGFTWLAFFVIQALRGSSGNGSILGLEACGLGYWLLTLTQIPLAVGVTYWTTTRLRASHAAKYNVGGDGAEIVVSPQNEDGFVLTPKSLMLLSWMALIAGMLGGLLGIGGGMIVNPLLLTVGMPPQVTAGTCASMVFFSSTMSVVQYWLMGRVPLDWALSSAVLCAIFSSVGVVLVHRAIDKYNRASIIVFSVTAVMGVSALIMGGFGGFQVLEKYMAGDYMGFHKFC